MGPVLFGDLDVVISFLKGNKVLGKYRDIACLK